MGSTEETTACKKKLRQRYLRLRSELGVDVRRDADARIAERLFALPEYRQAQLVLTYLSFGDEVDTRGIIEHSWSIGKEVALPRCVPGTRQMEWYVVRDLDHLVRSRFGVDEPAPDPTRLIMPVEAACGGAAVDKAAKDPRRMIALVPGLAFDEHGYRIGYGGGFYDVFLSGFAGRSIGLCREAQLFDDFAALGAVAPHDRPVDRVICG